MSEKWHPQLSEKVIIKRADLGQMFDALRARSYQLIGPTLCNGAIVYDDVLWRYIPPRMELSKEELTLQCEQAIRNYDPCISCATHFLKVEVEEA